MRPTRSAVVSVACLLCAFGVPSIGVAGDEPARPPETLTFRELAPASASERFSERVARLAGQPIRIVGYMAHFLEDPPKGMFYLCPLPVSLDEGGAGTGDLPPDHIRVSVPALAAQPLPFLPRPLEVTGVLDLGYREETDGSVSWIRLTVDWPPAGQSPKPSDPKPDKP